MKPFIRIAAAVAFSAAVVASFTAPAFAAPARAQQTRHGIGGHFGGHSFGADHAVFVQTDDPAANHVVAYHRGDDGSLSLAGTYATGGKGGVLTGSVVDHLASQGSLNYDAGHGLLLAVNAGSNTVSVFSASGDRLALRQVVGSGGAFPVSIAVHRDLVYVVNAENGGSVQGYRIFFGRLFPIFHSARSLNLDPNATPQFVNTPGQIAFSPDGAQVIVTTKANGSAIDVFRVGFFGYLSSAPVVNSLPNTVPFGVVFDHRGNLVVSQAGNNAVATYARHGNGTISALSSVETGQAATCWIVGVNGRYYASNAGSGNVTRVQAGPGGTLSILGNTATDAGTVDAAASLGGHYLYVQTGANGIVDGYRVNGDGSLTANGSVTVANAVGGEGIVAI